MDWADTFEKCVQCLSRPASSNATCFAHRVLSLSPPGTLINGSATDSWVFHIESKPHYGLADGSRFYVVGSLALLTTPGEFFVSSDSVYFAPPASPSLTDEGVEVVLSAGSRLLTIANTSHIVFDGLSFGVVRADAANVTDSTGIAFRNCTL